MLEDNGRRAWLRGGTETRTFIGRRRVDVEKLIDRLNTPVQRTGADDLKLALALLWERRGKCPGAGYHLAPRPPRPGCRNPCSKSCDPCPCGVSIPSGKLRRRPPEGDAKPAPPARRRPQGRGANPRLERDARYRRHSFPGCQPPWLGTCRWSPGVVAT